MSEIDLLIPNNIIRSKRKSISLIIKNNGEFVVRAPIQSTEREILLFINQKANWIITKRKELINNKIIPLTFNKIEKINLLDKTYNLTYDCISRVKCQDDKIILPKENSKERLKAFLKKFAKTYITERVKLIANVFNFKYESISISSARTCWGSCSEKNNLHFTYKLIMCPKDVVDYIVLHELCHTKVKNHSKKFWLLVEKCNPNYKTHEIWLKKNRAIIELI